MSRKSPKCKPGEPPNYLAQSLREWRKKTGWPLKKVAAEFGVTEATWSRWESGDRFPEHEFIHLLSDFVQIPVCRFFCLLALVLSMVNLSTSIAHAQGTAFTYQGRLNGGGSPATGIYDFRFTICDAVTNGTLVAVPLTNSATGVTNGLFTVSLDFGGGIFTGNALWLELGVRTNGSGSFTTLAPRQPILPTPYAIMANTASNLLGTLPAAQLSGAIPASQLSGTVPLAQLPNGVLTNNQTGVNLSGSFNGNGSALTNLGGTLVWQSIAGSTQQAAPNVGYMVSSSNLVTITLPASPNPGDIVRVSGVGAGGWKIAQNSGQAVLAGNAIALNVGSTWTARGSTNNWHCVACSADGTKLVAGTYGSQLYTSTDSGMSWTPRGTTNGWSSVASSTDGSRLVAVIVIGGQIYTSADSGVTWAAHGPSTNWQCAASSSDASRLVAGVFTGGGQLYTSSDYGATWSPHGPATNWISVASSTDGVKLAAAAYGGQIYISTDSGTNWTPHGSPASWAGIASSSDGTRLVAVVYGGQIFTSTDSGSSWTPCATAANWYGVTCSPDGTKLLAFVQNGQLYTSNDEGATWTPRESSRNWLAATCSADGTKLTAVVYGGQIYTSSPLLPSPGVTTTVGTTGYLIGGQGTAIELQYIGNGQFLPISYAGTIFGY